MVREIILDADKIEEVIKWNSPTFIYKGNMASFMMNAKKHITLMFHEGAKLENKSGLLEGDGKKSRAAKFKNMEDIITRRVIYNLLLINGYFIKKTNHYENQNESFCYRCLGFNSFYILRYAKKHN